MRVFAAVLLILSACACASTPPASPCERRVDIDDVPVAEIIKPFAACTSLSLELHDYSNSHRYGIGFHHARDVEKLLGVLAAFPEITVERHADRVVIEVLR